MPPSLATSAKDRQDDLEMQTLASRHGGGGAATSFVVPDEIDSGCINTQVNRVVKRQQQTQVTQPPKLRVDYAAGASINTVLFYKRTAGRDWSSCKFHLLRQCFVLVVIGQHIMVQTQSTREQWVHGSHQPKAKPPWSGHTPCCVSSNTERRVL